MLAKDKEPPKQVVTTAGQEGKRTEKEKGKSSTTLVPKTHS
jgi:hypothetical protein